MKMENISLCVVFAGIVFTIGCRFCCHLVHFKRGFISRFNELHNGLFEIYGHFNEFFVKSFM